MKFMASRRFPPAVPGSRKQASALRRESLGRPAAREGRLGQIGFGGFAAAPANDATGTIVTWNRRGGPAQLGSEVSKFRLPRTGKNFAHSATSQPPLCGKYSWPGLSMSMRWNIARTTCVSKSRFAERRSAHGRSRNDSSPAARNAAVGVGRPTKSALRSSRQSARLRRAARPATRPSARPF